MKKDDLKFDRSRCVDLHLRKTNRAISPFYDRHLPPSGTQYAMPQRIQHLDHITLGDLSQMLGMDQSTATREIDILHKMGLVVFAASPADARKKFLP